MADTFKGIITADGKKRTFAREGITPEYVSDKTLSVDGGFADAKVTGDAVKSLKEDIDNLSSSKISKFYASSQGETHLADSDNGKIMDMMVYGKSEQKKYGGYQLIPLGLKNANGTILSLPYTRDGITINITDDGKGFSVKGTNTTSDYADFYITKANEISLGAGTYTRSGKGFTKDIQMVSGGGAGAGGCLQYRLDSADFSTTETVEAGLSGNHILHIPANTTVNTTVYYQLEKGSKAHDYEPYTGGIPSPSPDYPQEIKSVVNPTVKVTNEDGLKVQSVTLNNITLNAIPVSSGGNVTIDGQQYIADYVDVERGKLVRMVGVTDQDTFFTSKWDTGSIVIYSQISNVGTENAIVTISSKFLSDWSAGDEIHHFTQQIGQTLVIVLPKTITTVEQGEAIRAKGFKFYYILVTPIEIDLTTEEVQAFKALATYYPITNISINSEQLDGYTVFNYPISMENGWNYVKQQIGDTRDYIYDMDLQSAEAYVNSEYAVALTELEV